MADFKVGEVTHYYQSVGIAMVHLASDLGTGDKIKFVSGDEVLFTQIIEVLQVGYKKLTMARKGELVGLKTINEVKNGTEVYKTTED